MSEPWIAVADRLPEPGLEVRTEDGRILRRIHRRDFGIVWQFSSPFGGQWLDTQFPPTHWLPIPEKGA